MKFKYDGKKGEQITPTLPGPTRKRMTLKPGDVCEIEERYVEAFSSRAIHLGLVPASPEDAKRYETLMAAGKPLPKPGGVTLEAFEDERERRLALQKQLRELEENVRKNGARAADEEVAALQAKLKESQNAQAWLSEELAKARNEAAETKALVSDLSARLTALEKPKGK